LIYWYKLHFTSPVHIGERGIGVESVSNVIHSTTIHGALINALLLLNRINTRDVRNIDLRLNTPAPILDIEGSTEKLLWLRGLHILWAEKLRQYLKDDVRLYNELIKKLKSTFLVTSSFLDHDILECRVEMHGANSRNEEIMIRCGGDEYRLLSIGGYFGNIILTNNIGDTEIAGIAEHEIRPRNRIDRITSAAEPYHLGLIRFHKPLLLGIKNNSSILSRNDIEAALRFLGDTGIGGERTYGFGKFSFEKTDGIRVNNDDQAKHVVVQGLYSPPPEKLGEILGNSIYQLMIHGFRSGYTGIVRKPVPVLREGSIIYCDGECNGRTVIDREPLGTIIRSFNPITTPFKTSDNT